MKNLQRVPSYGGSPHSLPSLLPAHLPNGTLPGHLLPSPFPFCPQDVLVSPSPLPPAASVLRLSRYCGQHKQQQRQPSWKWRQQHCHSWNPQSLLGIVWMPLLLLVLVLCLVISSLCPPSYSFVSRTQEYSRVTWERMVPAWLGCLGASSSGSVGKVLIAGCCVSRDFWNSQTVFVQPVVERMAFVGSEKSECRTVSILGESSHGRIAR